VTGPTRVISALYVDLGEGREIKTGDRAGQIRWTRPPRARFECLLCGTEEVPAIGPKEPVPAAVAQFVATIRSTHQTRCNPQHTTTTERQAA
jgi:hypothetical protein